MKRRPTEPHRTSEAPLDARLAAWLEAGTREHYADAALYDHEYRRRRADVRFYREVAARPSPGRKQGRRTILELGCGTGRVTLPLVRDGHEVVGVDLSSTMLGELERKAGRLPASVRGRLSVARADFRALALDRKFDLVLAPFNTLMHCYAPADLDAVLGVVRRHLRPSGRFVFDVMNPDLRWLSRDPERRWARTRFRHPVTGRRMVYSTNLVFDTPLQIAFMRIYYEPDRPRPSRGRARVVRLAHRYFFPRELDALVRHAGFVLDEHLGDFAGGTLLPESEYQVCVARCAPPARSPVETRPALRRKTVDKRAGRV